MELSPQSMAFLCIVAHQGRDGISRPDLIRILWGVEPDAGSRRWLAQTFYDVRSVLGPEPFFGLRSDTVRLRDGALATDLDEVRDALERREPGAVKEWMEHEFLARLSFRRKGFEEWVEEQGQRFRHEVRQRASRLLEEAEGRADWSRAADAAELLLSLDPTDEGPLQSAIRARAAGGQLREAEATYRSFRERATTHSGDPDWEPSSETLELLDTLRSLRRPTAEDAGGVRRGRSEPPLVGRGSALRELSALVHPPFSDGLWVAVVQGEAGMGKTRLVEEGLARVALDGVLSLRGRCSEFQAEVPLSPLLDAFEHPAVRDVVHRLDDPWRGVILNLMPELLQPGQSLPEIPEVEPDGPPRRLCEAIHVLLKTIAADQPLVLFLDDVHWADATTRAVMDHLHRRREELPARLIVTARPEELQGRPSPRRFVESLAGADDAYSVEVPALTEDESRELVNEIAAGRLAEPELQRIGELGQGCPLFLIELTQEALQGRPGIGDEAIHSHETATLPRSIEQLLDARIDDLRASERAVLEIMTVYDRPIHPTGLVRLVDLTEDEAIQALRTLEGRRLARATEAGEVVAHGLMARGVYQRIGYAQRAVYHRRVAEHLLEKEGDTSLGRVALHFHWAGEKDRARDSAMDAAERAQEAGAVQEVAALLEVARANAEDAAQDTQIVRRLGNLHYRHRDFEQASHFLGEAVPGLQALGLTEDALECEVRRIHVEASQDSHDQEDHLTQLQELKKEAKAREFWGVLNEALDIELRLRDSTGDEAGVRAVLHEAESILGHGPPSVECRTLAILSIHLYYGELDRALEVCLQAVELARKQSLQHELLLALNRLVLVFVTQGTLETERGLSTIREAQHLGSQSGDFLERFNPFLNLAVWYMDTGRFDEADLTFSQAQELLKATPDQSLRRTLHTNLGELRLHQERYDEALAHFDWIGPHAGNPASPKHQLLWASGKGLTYLCAGAYESALHYWNGPNLPSVTWVMDPYLPVTFTAHMLNYQGDPEAAQDLLLTVSHDIKDRFVPASLKLDLEFVRLFGEACPKTAAELARKGHNTSKTLGLHQRATEFSTLLDRLG